MNKPSIDKIERISIDLLKLKPLKDLKAVYEFYKKEMERFFNEKGEPYQEFFNFISCPICGSNDYVPKIKLDNFLYNECQNCQVVFNSPRLKDEFMEKMYEQGEYKTYFKRLVVQSQDIRKNIIERRKFKQIDSFFDRPGKILDVGCGSGSFLKTCQEQGWEVYGIDPSGAAVKTAKKMYGLDIIEDRFENYETQILFDCVTFWGLEHLSRPMKGVEKALSLLKPGGLIVFESPSADCLLWKYIFKNHFVPYRYLESARHILFFSRKSIDYICQRFNLELAYLESNGLDIQTILLAEPDDKMQEKILKIQQVIDECLLADHYRVFLKKYE